MIIGFDGDTIFWTAACARKDIPLKEAFAAAAQLVKSAFKIHETEEYMMAVTSTDMSNFRYKVKTTIKGYKANRKDKKKPEHLMEVRQYLIDKYGAVEVFGMEADDKLGIWQCKNMEEGVASVIHGKDKDLKQIPGRHCDYKGNITEVTELGHLKLYRDDHLKIPKWKLEGSGLKWFYAQCIIGDSCDNIPGIYKKGPIFAYDTLYKCNSEYALYKATLKAFGNKQHMMDEQAQLCYILRRDEEYWFDRKAKLLRGEL
jgi:5'-3' exonuclease